MTAVQLALEMPLDTEFPPEKEYQIDPLYSDRVQRLARKAVRQAFEDAQYDARAVEWLLTTGLSWLQIMGHDLGEGDIRKALYSNAFDKSNYQEETR